MSFTNTKDSLSILVNSWTRYLLRRNTALLLLPVSLLYLLWLHRRKKPLQAIQTILFPTYCVRVNERHWQLHLHGRVVRPWTMSLLDRAFIDCVGFLGSRGFTSHARAMSKQLLYERLRLLFSSPQSHQRRLVINVNGETHLLHHATDDHGHFREIICVSDPELLLQGFVEYEAEDHRSDDKKNVAAPNKGRARLISPRGITVISDIDDCIKVTDTCHKLEAMKNTLLREFVPVPLMNTAYANWHRRSPSVAFHYVSASPAQLFQALNAFLRETGFPEGHIKLRKMGFCNLSLLRFLRHGAEGYKVRSVARIVRMFPDRRFVLVGDGGQTDPEEYAKLARLFPNQICSIFIRDYSRLGHEALHQRCTSLFNGLSVRWRLFQDGHDLLNVDLESECGFVGSGDRPPPD